MKIKEMQKYCHDHKGICEGCPMNANKNWYENLESWCMIQLKKDYIKAYKEYKAEGNEQLAEMVMKRYKEIEQECIGEINK